MKCLYSEISALYWHGKYVVNDGESRLFVAVDRARHFVVALAYHKRVQPASSLKMSAVEHIINYLKAEISALNALAQSVCRGALYNINISACMHLEARHAGLSSSRQSSNACFL